MAFLSDMVEVTLAQPEDFLKVRETLTRIGVASQKENKLFQSCHILHKQRRYFIVHFKELFALDGRPSNFTDDDRARRNTIASLLHQWKLVTLLDKDAVNVDMAPMANIKIIPFRDKELWVLEPKYTIGVKKEGLPLVK